MEKAQIKESLRDLFSKVFENQNIELKDEMTASEVDNWDSFTHVVLISEIEACFEVKFKLKDLNKLKNVGDIIDNVHNKILEK